MTDHSRKIGYARVSTEEQSLDMQIDQLIKAGVAPNDIFTDKISGVSENRPGFKDCMIRLREGDTLVIWKIDRLARSMAGFIKITENLASRGIKLHSLTEPVGDDTPMGKAFQRFAVMMAELERDLISERTKARLAHKKAQGVEMGPPRKITREIWNFAVVQRKRGISYPKIAERAAAELGFTGKQNAFYTYKKQIDAEEPYPWDTKPPEAQETDWAET